MYLKAKLNFLETAKANTSSILLMLKKQKPIFTFFFNFVKMAIWLNILNKNKQLINLNQLKYFHKLLKE